MKRFSGPLNPDRYDDMTNTNELIELIRRFAESNDCKSKRPVTQSQIKEAESKLGFQLPKLLTRIYTEISDGGIGPGNGFLGLLNPFENGDHSLVEMYREIKSYEDDQRWPNGLIYLCDWGCAVYTCLDCNSSNYQIVTHDPELTETHWTLETWLNDWINGINIYDQMFEPPSTITGINPFTGKPHDFKSQGKAKY